jgi:hypothetical protein
MRALQGLRVPSFRSALRGPVAPVKPEDRGRRIGEALAFLSGDDRDEPLLCARCRSSEVDQDLRGRDVLACRACGCETTMFVAADDRHRRMRKRAEPGIGELVDLLKDEES